MVKVVDPSVCFAVVILGWIHCVRPESMVGGAGTVLHCVSLLADEPVMRFARESQLVGVGSHRRAPFVSGDVFGRGIPGLLHPG